jgi:hypothetical protein
MFVGDSKGKREVFCGGFVPFFFWELHSAFVCVLNLWIVHQSDLPTFELVVGLFFLKPYIAVSLAFEPFIITYSELRRLMTCFTLTVLLENKDWMMCPKSFSRKVDDHEDS